MESGALSCRRGKVAARFLGRGACNDRAAAVMPRLRRAITLPTKTNLYPTRLLHPLWVIGDGHEPYRPTRHHSQTQ